MSKTLNKEIKGPLTKKPSRATALIVLTIVFAIIWGYSVSLLGLETGTAITLVLAVIGISAYLNSKWQVEASSKHKWKPLENDKED